MPFIKLDKVNLFYEVHGTGFPLLLIHGYSCDHSLWQPHLEALTTQYQLIIFDLRGSGQTEFDNKAFTIENLANDIYALCQALQINKAHILGHSMGGAVAQCLSYYYPQLIDKLIILNSSAKFSIIARQALKSILALQENEVPLDFLIDCFMPWGFSSDFLANAEKVENYKKADFEYPYLSKPLGNRLQLQALDHFDFRDKLREITAPTLIVGTENDYLVAPSEIQFLAHEIPTAHLKMMPGGHVMLIEEPNIYSDIILQWCQAP